MDIAVGNKWPHPTALPLNPQGPHLGDGPVEQPTLPREAEELLEIGWGEGFS